MLQFGEELLYHITGFLYRYKKLRTHDEVVNYFISLYYKKGEFGLQDDILFRRDSKYIKFIEDTVNTPIYMVSVGPDRTQTIIR